MLFTHIKADSAQGRKLLERASRYEGHSLAEVYANPSDEKRKAYRNSRDLYDIMDGHNFRICAHNAQQFTVAWNGDYEDGSGNVIYNATYLLTAYNSYVIY